MVTRMKTTLVIGDKTMQLVRERAAREGTTISALVENALRRFLKDPPTDAKLDSLPCFDGGGTAFDIADRDALFEAMDE